MSISAMKQALEALELVDKDIEWHPGSPTRKSCYKAILALRQAIEDAEEAAEKSLRGIPKSVLLF